MTTTAVPELTTTKKLIRYPRFEELPMLSEYDMTITKKSTRSQNGLLCRASYS